MGARLAALDSRLNALMQSDCSADAPISITQEAESRERDLLSAVIENASGTNIQPLLSQDLKDRLEDLVNQVKGKITSQGVPSIDTGVGGCPQLSRPQEQYSRDPCIALPLHGKLQQMTTYSGNACGASVAVPAGNRQQPMTTYGGSSCSSHSLVSISAPCGGVPVAIRRVPSPQPPLRLHSSPTSRPQDLALSGRPQIRAPLTPELSTRPLATNTSLLQNGQPQAHLIRPKYEPLDPASMRTASPRRSVKVHARRMSPERKQLASKATSQS